MCTICHFLTTLVPFFFFDLCLFVPCIICLYYYYFFVVIKKKRNYNCPFVLRFFPLFFPSSSSLFYLSFPYFSLLLLLFWCSPSFGLCSFKKKKIEVFIHNFFNNKMCYLFVLVNEGIIINLYQLHFLSSYFFSQSNKTILIPSLFHLSNQIHTRRN